MSSTITKSKNLDVYPYFMNYDDPRDIPYERIAEKLGRAPNSLRGMIRSARHNSTIYLALRKQGYRDKDFPDWFARPYKPLEYRRVETVGTSTGAGERSVAGKRSEPKRGYIQNTMGLAQDGGAERPSALSMRSAPPVHTYRIIQPTYHPPVNPYLEKMSQLLMERLEKKMADSMEQFIRRQEPLRQKTPQELKAQLEMTSITQKMEWQRIAHLWFIINMLQSGSNSKRIDMDELLELLSKPLEELRKIKGYDANAWIKNALEVIGRFIQDSIPKRPPSDVLLRAFKETEREERESQKEAIIELAKIMAEDRRRKNRPLELFKREHRKILNGFYKNLNGISETRTRHN